MSSNLPPDPPKDLPSIISFGTIEQHVHYNTGPNAQSASASSRTNSPAAVTQNNFFSRQMAKHGPGYWCIHLFVALFATALYEFLVWLFGSAH
jgi:hypothetical protein